jgi:hypothetical protein
MPTVRACVYLSFRQSTRLEAGEPAPHDRYSILNLQALLLARTSITGTRLINDNGPGRGEIRMRSLKMQLTLIIIDKQPA